MGYTDTHGRPEWIAQPFVKKGTAQSRVVEVETDRDSPEFKQGLNEVSVNSGRSSLGEKPEEDPMTSNPEDPAGEEDASTS